MVVIVVMSFELLVLHGGQLGRDDLTGGGDSQGDRPVAQPAEVQLHRLDLDLTPSAWRGGRGGREGGAPPPPPPPPPRGSRGDGETCEFAMMLSRDRIATRRRHRCCKRT